MTSPMHPPQQEGKWDNIHEHPKTQEKWGIRLSTPNWVGKGQPLLGPPNWEGEVGPLSTQYGRKGDINSHKLWGKTGAPPAGKWGHPSFWGGEIGNLTGAPKRGAELGCPQTPSRAGQGPPKAPPRDPPVWARGITGTSNPPQKPP